MSSPAKLTDTQRAILFEASQRKDRCLISPKTLKAAAAQKVATKLLKAGLVREIKAKTGMEAWRRDEETGQAYSLKLTDAGLKAIAADERGSQSIPSTAVPQNTNEDSRMRRPQQIWRRPGAQRPTRELRRRGRPLAHNNELVSHFNNLGDRSFLITHKVRPIDLGQAHFQALWRAKSKRHHPVKNSYCLWLF